MQDKLTEKIGTSCLIRRSVCGEDILIFLLRTGEILKTQSDTLSKILQLEGTNVRKNLSKAGKIRLIMKLPRIQAVLPEETLGRLEEKLQEMEKKNKKKSTDKITNEDEAIAKLCLNVYSLT